jgi:hypothetical protein
VADVEGLCDIERGIFYNDFFALSRGITPVAWGGCEMGEGVDLCQDVADDSHACALKVQEGLVVGDQFNVFVRLEL